MFEYKKSKFGENLKKYRNELGLTQEALAELVGLEQETIARFETAKRNPSFDTIFKLAEALNTDEKDLFDFTSQ